MSGPVRLCLGCGRQGQWGRAGRCPACLAIRKRATERNPRRLAIKTQRYDAGHRQQRKAWAIVIASGERVLCARCRLPIGPLDDWHLDHQADGQSHPSHGRCNVTAITRKAKP